MNEMKDKVVLITGATSGIGFATAMYLAKLGANVVGTARHETDLVTELKKVGARGALLLQADMTQEDEVRNMINETIAAFGQLDCAFNNAGIFIHEASLEEHLTDTWHDVITSNLTSIYLCMKYEINAMRRTEHGGVVINNASVVGHRGSAASGIAYTTAKHGVIGLTRQAAITYATSGIRINAISPGPTLTPATSPGIDLKDSASRAKIGQLNPTEKMVPIETIAATVAFLCSDQAKGINGHDIPIDGGQLAKL